MMNIKFIKNELTEELMKPSPCVIKQYEQLRTFKELVINNGKTSKAPNNAETIYLNYA